MRKLLVVKFDVTDLSEEERLALEMEVAVQGEASDLHGDAEVVHLGVEEAEDR